MLRLVEIGSRDVTCPVRATSPYQPPLINARGGVLEEVVQQDLYSVKNLRYPARQDLHR